MKTCSKCKEEKEESLFGKNNAKKDKLHCYCKGCSKSLRDANILDNKKRAKEYYVLNKDKLKEYSKLYRINNSDKLKEKRKEYLLHNPEKEKVWRKSYKQRHRLKINEKTKIYYAKNKENRIFWEKKYYAINKENINAKKRERYNLDKLSHLKYKVKHRLKVLIGEEPQNELVETIVLINQTRQLCRTLNN